MPTADLTEQKTVYRERSPWPAWVGFLYWAAMTGVCYALLIGYDTDLPFRIRLPLTTLIAGAAAGLDRLFNGLTVLVQEDRIFMYLGSWPLIKRAVPFSEILDAEAVEYNPLVEFGGWGVRGVGKKKAWSARGRRAVLLTLTGDRLLYVGSDHPQRLEERIRSTAGDRFGASGG